jgi:ATP-dependent DNA helicase RecQ
LYRPEDKAIQSFFKGGRFPSDEDLINAYHALKRLADETGPATVAELQAISPVPKTRLATILTLFKQRGIVIDVDRRRILLDQTDLTPDDLHRIAAEYRERDERDRLKLHRMIEYAETRSCRWCYLQSYFAGDDSGAGTEPCGHCDRCPPRQDLAA